jgi:hypothetical protein
MEISGVCIRCSKPMPAKINHIAVLDPRSASTTWTVLQILWPLLGKLLNGVEVMSIQNFKSRPVKNIPLKNGTLPAQPRHRPDDLIFFYGSTTTGGAASAYERGEYRCVGVSLNPPTDSEIILFEMWDLLEFLNPVGVFSGEEMEIYEHHIKAVESGRLTPLALPLCEIAIVRTNDSRVAENSAKDGFGTAVRANGTMFRKTR